MEQFLDNKYVFWIVTAIVGGIFALTLYLIKKQIDGYAKQLEQLKADAQKNTDKITDILTNLPIQYTLRDEFIRITTDISRKYDKLTDSVTDVSNGIASLMSALKGVNKCDHQ